MSPAYYRRQEVRRNARKISTSSEPIEAAEEVAVDDVKTSESHFRGIEVIEADEVSIKCMDETEASVSNESDAE